MKNSNDLKSWYQKDSPLLDLSAVGVWEWYVDEGVLHCSETVLQVLGLDHANNLVDEEEFLSRIHTEDLGRFGQGIGDCLEGRLTAFEMELRMNSKHRGELRVISRCVPATHADDNVPRIDGILVDITRQHKLEASLQLAASGVSSTSGRGFFESLVRYLCETLEGTTALVGRLDSSGTFIDTIAVWRDGEFRDNFRYRLDISPCQDVVGRKICVFCENVWHEFPDDKPLVDARIEGYAGAPLYDSRGKPIGLMALLSRNTIDQPELHENLLKVFAVRAQMEMERMDQELALRESEQVFRDYASASADHFWETDSQHRFSYVSSSADGASGSNPDDVLGKTRWELAGRDPESDPFWKGHLEMLDRHETFRDVHYSLDDSRGVRTYLSISGVPAFSDSGEFRGYRGTTTDITHRVVAEVKEREAQRRLALAIEASSLYVWDWAVGSGVTEWSPHPSELLGPEPPGGYPDFKTMVHPQDLDGFLTANARCVKDGLPYRAEFRLHTTDGRWRWISARGILIRDSNGNPLRVTGVSQDVTRQKQTEEALRISATVFETREAMLIADADATILDVNSALVSLTGYGREELVGKKPDLFYFTNLDRRFFRSLWRNLRARGHWHGEIPVRTSNGVLLPMWVSINSVLDDRNRVSRYVATYTDLSERKEAEERIDRLSNFDHLTNLPNRRQLSLRIDSEIDHCRLNNCLAGLLLMDLDGFRTINESLGYDMGDEVLRKVASILEPNIKECDQVARTGADEFAALICDLGSDPDSALEKLNSISDKVMAEISRPISIGGDHLYLSMSMGITTFPEDTEIAEDVVSRAEIAMHQARTEGYGRSRVFRSHMKQRSDQRLVIQNQVSAALHSSGLHTYYQCQYDQRGGIVGAEALARLALDDGSVILPEQFIDVAEETGLIVPVGYRVLDHALSDLRNWLEIPDCPLDFVSVNVSPKQCLRDDFASSIIDCLRAHGIEGRFLELEITENLLVADFQKVSAMMHTLRNAGVRFAIDDFGAGHSSLSYLKKLPVDKLKIDRSLVVGLENGESGLAIVQAIISMSKILGLEVVAEGVESRAISNRLVELGCDLQQGYLFNRPSPAETIATLFPGNREASSEA